MTKASKIAVTMLDVGQGSGTFVEIYTGTKITATALLDLGSERAKDEAGGPSVDYLVKQLTSMTKPRIDFFSLSHSDSDHINLVQDLLAFFDPPGTKKPKKPILEIGSVIYGGPRVLYAKHSGTNVLTSIEAYQPKGTTKPQPLPSNNSSFYGTAPMFAKDEVEIRLLVGNHVSSEPRTVRKKIGDKQWRTDSYSLNTYSLIFVVAFDDAHGTAVHREDLNESPVKELLSRQGDWVSMEKFFLTDKIPYKWVVWGYSKSKGWDERIEHVIDHTVKNK